MGGPCSADSVRREYSTLNLHIDDLHLSYSCFGRGQQIGRLLHFAGSLMFFISFVFFRYVLLDSFGRVEGRFRHPRYIRELPGIFFFNQTRAIGMFWTHFQTRREYLTKIGSTTMARISRDPQHLSVYTVKL